MPSDVRNQIVFLSLALVSNIFKLTFPKPKRSVSHEKNCFIFNVGDFIVINGNGSICSI
jgi:hypothetical protein